MESIPNYWKREFHSPARRVMADLLSQRADCSLSPERRTRNSELTGRKQVNFSGKRYYPPRRLLRRQPMKSTASSTSSSHVEVQRTARQRAIAMLRLRCRELGNIGFEPHRR